MRGEDCVRRITHTRKCEAVEPCDWPAMRGGDRERDMRFVERRGRRRARSYDYSSDDVYVERRRSSSRPRVITRKESRNRVGLGIISGMLKGKRDERVRSRVRYVSVSPPATRTRTREVRYF